MTIFSKEQQDFALNMRRVFNANESYMGEKYGAMLQGRARVGNAAPIPKDVWGQWDKEGLAIQRNVLSVYSDLAGSVAMPIPIGKLAHYFQRIGDSGGANVSIDGEVKPKADQPAIDYVGTPLPIVTDSYAYSWRQMEAAQSEGYALDMAGRDNSMRKVAEKLEDICLLGDSKVVVGGSTLYGLLNHPKRNTDTHGVDLNGATGAQWLAAVSKVITKLQGDNYFGEITVYLNWGDWTYATINEFTAGYSKTIAQRLQEIGNIRFVPAGRVPANTLCGVVKQRNAVQLLSGMPMVVVPQARLNPQDRYVFNVMAASALEIKYDMNDNCGVACVTKT